MVNLRKAMINTALGYVANMNAMPEGAENWARGRHPDATHWVFPLSLEATPKGNQEMVDFIRDLLPGLSSFETIFSPVNPIQVDEKQHLVTISVNGTGETAVGNYFQEFIFTLETTEDGTQVRNSWEWVDSVLAEEYLSRLDL